MPGKDRPSSIPKRTIPVLKRNEPIPLRGTRPTQDAYTPAPARSRIPSANIPVMHSPAPSSRSSSSSAYSLSEKARSANSSTETVHLANGTETRRESPSEDGSETASAIDDTLSPGFSRILALLESEAGEGSNERKESLPEEVDGTKIDLERPLGMPGFFPGGMISPFKIPGLEDSISTSRTGSWGAPRVGLSNGVGNLMPKDPTNSLGSGRMNSLTSLDSSLSNKSLNHGSPKTSYSLQMNSPSRGQSGLEHSLETPRASTWRTTSISEETDGTHGESRDSLPSLPIHTMQDRSPSSIIPTPTLPQNASGPYAILRELQTLLGPNVLAETIDLQRILCAHDACPSPSAPSIGSSVFGTSLCGAARYASCSTVLGGKTHMLPIVIFAAVEELYRAGLTSPRLLRPASTSNGTTLPSLVAAFDAGPTYGDGIDLSRTLTPLDDVSALLLTYLDCLPGPIIVRPLLPALLRFCIRSQTPNLQAAQLFLRLLPAPHFSLLVYLLAFLAQVPRYKTVNGWNVKNIAGAFARVVCGSSEEGEGEDVLEWLVRNWDALSMGLFPGAIVPSDDDDLGARIAGLEQQHEMAIRAAYAAGAADERSVFAGEMQALREAWEREGKIMGGIVRRFAEGAPGAERR